MKLLVMFALSLAFVACGNSYAPESCTRHAEYVLHVPTPKNPHAFFFAENFAADGCSYFGAVELGSLESPGCGGCLGTSAITFAPDGEILSCAGPSGAACTWSDDYEPNGAACYDGAVDVRGTSIDGCGVELD